VESEWHRKRSASRPLKHGNVGFGDAPRKISTDSPIYSNSVLTPSGAFEPKLLSRHRKIALAMKSALPAAPWRPSNERVEAFGKPVVDFGQHRAGFVTQELSFRDRQV
jgi:hypothetical protein